MLIPRPRRALAGVALPLTLLLGACGGTGTDAGQAASDEPEGADTSDAAAGDAGGLFAGELIEISLGVSPGGGYDTYARALAPFLAEELDADVTVSNNPGAGGLLNLNQVYTGVNDGTVITLINGTGTLGSVLSDAQGVEFEIGEFEWLGRLAAEPRVMNVYADLPYEDIQELMGTDDEITFATTGPGGGSHLTSALLMEILDLQNARFISGFEGSAESNLAVVAGEVMADANTASTSLPFVEAGDQRVLVVVGDEPLEDMYPGVPSLYDIGLEGERLVMAESLVAINGLGRALAAPPGVPADRLAELRQALENIANDPAFIEEFERQDLELDWRGHEEVERIIATALDTPDSVRAIIAENS
ncbi:Bug family tripartite tricarboxylate transporter substrate binding protein [Egicoccus sp. AB-alg2]|uniref:Bug family tripartite tricarboxylate transporter substrate binding protein n=1 Tax=Egicoccus sp. AB-alg2 TaxID=3242693 RepID=UPI00359ECE47